MPRAVRIISTNNMPSIFITNLIKSFGQGVSIPTKFFGVKRGGDKSSGVFYANPHARLGSTLTLNSSFDEGIMDSLPKFLFSDSNWSCSSFSTVVDDSASTLVSEWDFSYESGESDVASLAPSTVATSFEEDNEYYRKHPKEIFFDYDTGRRMKERPLTADEQRRIKNLCWRMDRADSIEAYRDQSKTPSYWPWHYPSTCEFGDLWSSFDPASKLTMGPHRFVYPVDPPAFPSSAVIQYFLAHPNEGYGGLPEQWNGTQSMILDQLKETEVWLAMLGAHHAEDGVLVQALELAIARVKVITELSSRDWPYEDRYYIPPRFRSLEKELERILVAKERSKSVVGDAWPKPIHVYEHKRVKYAIGKAKATRDYVLPGCKMGTINEEDDEA
ncbi:hypothetical protein T439DRAFT_351663 [Meredithblackwellia eburnea MCA 4105]